MRVNVPISVGGWARLFTRWDILAVLLILGLLVFLGEASRDLFEPLTELQKQPPSLDPRHLPEYAARTTLRMLVAMVVSLVFTFTYATLAAKSQRAERILVPLLDILQSVPILGFLSVTVVFFMSLVPGRVLGAEFAAIFAIFTSQAWNMAFSFYQSLRTVPTELEEAARNFRLSPWMRFWRLEVPFAMPPLIWNMMMSMSGGWFFVVASEAISVGNTTVTLPGVGSYIALAIEQRDLQAVGWAIAAMLVVILIYDQLLFRPLVAWADRFRFEQEPGGSRAAILGVRRAAPLARRRAADGTVRRAVADRRCGRAGSQAVAGQAGRARSSNALDRAICSACSRSRSPLSSLWRIADFFIGAITWPMSARVAARPGDADARGRADRAGQLIWVPIGVWVGLRPRVANMVQPVAQFLAAFPANLLFPLVVSVIVACRLDPDIWLSPLMILGTQWYILFNVIAGASAIPAELRDAARISACAAGCGGGASRCPRVFPYYVTGAITASGGSWNASIVAEVASWGDEQLQAHGLGAYIAHATDAGDFHRIVLGIAVMSLFVVVMNRVFWRPLYYYAERKFRLG